MNSTLKAKSHGNSARDHIAAVKVFREALDCEYAKDSAESRAAIGKLHDRIGMGLKLAAIEAQLETADAVWELVLAVQNARADVVGAVGDLREDNFHDCKPADAALAGVS